MPLTGDASPGTGVVPLSGSHQDPSGGPSENPGASGLTAPASSPTYPGGESYVPLPPHSREHVAVALGVRVGFLRDRGVDPYSTNDMLAQSSLGASGTFWHRRPFSLAATFAWDYGARQSQARGVESSLNAHRLTAGLRVGWELADLLTIYGRAAPGAVHLVGKLDDTTTGLSQTADPWTWSVDLAAGAILPLANLGTSTFPVNFQVFGEGGYGFAGRADMTFHANLPDGDRRRVTGTTLPSLSPSGGYFTLGLGVAM